MKTPFILKVSTLLVALTLVIGIMFGGSTLSEASPLVNCSFDGNGNLSSHECLSGQSFSLISGQADQAKLKQGFVEFKGKRTTGNHSVHELNETIEYGSLRIQPDLMTPTSDTFQVYDFGRGWQVTLTNKQQDPSPKLLLRNEDSGYIGVFSLSTSTPAIEFVFHDNVQELIVDGESLALLDVVPGNQVPFQIRAWGDQMGTVRSKLDYLVIEPYVPPSPLLVDDGFDGSGRLQDYQPDPFTHAYSLFYGFGQGSNVVASKVQYTASIDWPDGHLLTDPNGIVFKFDDGVTVEYGVQLYNPHLINQMVFIVEREVMYMWTQDSRVYIQYANGTPVELTEVDGDYYGDLKIVRDNADGSQVYWNGVLVLQKSTIDMEDEYAILRFQGLGQLIGGGDDTSLVVDLDYLRVTLP